MMESRDQEGCRRFLRLKDQLKKASIETLRVLQSKLNKKDIDEACFYKKFQKQIEINKEKLKKRRKSSRDK